MAKIVTIVGARPQFIKAAPVSRALHHAGHTEFLVHTGQHYDDNMSSIFFQDLKLPEPDVNLGVGSGSHAKQTGHMLIGLEEILLQESPDWVLVYGDTNSTLAGALAAVKLHLPIVHVEAGLRSFNKRMPEEHNRIVVDHVSNVLCCPTQIAVKNLHSEGIVEGVHLVGDVMYDSVLYNLKLAEERSLILERLQLLPRNYILATVHRAENTDNEKKLRDIFSAFETLGRDGYCLVVPLHPRTQNILKSLEISSEHLRIIPPVSYLDMIMLEKNAQCILTDSGGVQKESYWLRVPCLTLRGETEWRETVETGWNSLVGSDTNKIIMSVQNIKTPLAYSQLYGDGKASSRCAAVLERSQ